MLTRFNESLWGDEGFSAILSMRPLPEIVKTIVNDTSPPLWNIFEWFIFRTLGTGEIYIRLLAFVFFLGAVYFTYKIGEYLFEKKTGTVALLLTLLNPFFFIYAFEGRMYSILAFGVTASMYYFLKRRWFFYVFWSLWALYSHHFAIFALFIQGLWFVYELLFDNRKTAKKMFKAFIAVGIGYLLWIYPLYLQTAKVVGGFWLKVPDLIDLRNLIYDYLAEGIKSHPFKVLGAPLHQIGLWLTFVILILRFWLKEIKKTAFLLSWFLIPIFLAWTISQFFQSIFFNRYLLYSIPPAMLLLASLRRGRLSAAAIAAVLVIFATIDLHYFTNPTKIPFRELASYVQETRNQESFLINEDAGNHKLWESKYYGIPAPIYVPSGEALPFFVGTALMETEDIVETIPAGVKKLGVITFKKAEELSIEGFVPEEERRFGSLNFVWMNPD